MAKKVTIQGNGILQDLLDAWGGVNTSNQPITPYSDRGATTVVPAGAEWGVNRGEVEKFIKDMLGVNFAKYGYLYIPLTKFDDGFYHLRCYLSEEAYQADPTDFIQDIPIPISTDKGVSYSARLVASTNALTDIVVSDRAYKTGLRFTSILNDNGDVQNAGENGTLNFERSVDGGLNWSSVGTATIRSRDADDTGFDEFEIGQYLVLDRKTIIRVRATYSVEGVGTFTSAWVNVVSATYTSLSLECMLNWQNPIQSSVIDTTGFPTSYSVHCAADMTLHIWIAGEGGSFDFERGQAVGNVFTTAISVPARDNGSTIVNDFRDNGGTNKLNTHGVHAVAAWLTCDDGLGNTLKSDIVVNRFMVINPESEDIGKPFIMLQNVIEKVDNYAKATICGYSVFIPQIVDGEVLPSEDPLPISIYITNRATNFPSGDVTYYLSQDVNVYSGIQYTLEASIGIESDFIGELAAYLRVWRDGVNFLNESIGEEYIYIAVDNTEAFVPTLGATFALNPALRSNDEANPKRILNSQDGNAEIQSTWYGFDCGENDGWVTADDGFKVLRVLAGQSLNFKFNPFAQFLTTPASSMTLEFDIKAFNVTNEDDPIVSLFEEINAGTAIQRRGLFIRPMEGNLYIKDSFANDETNFRWREGERTHIVINIENAVQPSVRGDGIYDPTQYPNPAVTVPIARVFINGNIEREMLFTADANQFCTGAMSNGGFTIGQNGADIDIYGIRCYANRSLTATNVVNDYIATLPTAEQKRQVRYDNDIMRGSRVDVEEVKKRGKRVLILHGDEPYRFRTTVGNIWWEIFQYDKEGNYMPELSGTICKQNGMFVKRQGSTANTYYYSNIQTKVGEINKDGDLGYISIPVDKIHPSLTVSEPYEVEANGTTKTVVGIYGGNLGKYDPWENEAKEYDYNNGMVTVPDGWIDGNGMYRGMGYMITENTPLALKLVLKVNYASSMQSHLCGGCRLYNDLHTAVVGKNELQQKVSTARVSKYTEPVFFFTQANGSDEVVFRGGGNFGGGKIDKPTWGYVKKKHPMFTMIEGSDNNFPLTDMRVPFITDPNCEEYARYDAGDEGWFYNEGGEGKQNLDFDAGKTDDDDIPVAATVNELQRMINFCYLHSPMIKYYDGNFDDFAVSANAGDVVSKYWCTQGSDQYLLKRYNFSRGRWENAGLWNGAGYDVIDLRTYEMTASKWNYLTNSEKGDPEKANAAFKAGIVEHAKKYLGWYFNVDSLKFHYAFQNHFMAGTDNCSKNTYFVLMPTAKSVTIDGVTQSVYLWELHQDDVDTILLTDNNGRSTKPYYIDRMHPYAEYDQHTSCYEGENNVLFNLVEAMWEDSRELQSMLKRIFSAMQGLVTEEDIAKGYTRSVMGCMNKYLFDIQRYFPIMAYNEQARIRYEFPALLGYVSSGSGARAIRPITQSMGNQLEAEMQFVIRRVIYMASYAGWGQLHDGGKSDDIGISDVIDGFGFQMFHLPNEQQSNNNYSFMLTAHQFIYPTGMLGQTAVDPHVRVKAGDSYRLNLGNTTTNDGGLSILGANMYTSFGNIGDLSTTPANSADVKGNRLTEFVSKPTTQYTENGKTVGAWRPNSITFNSPLVRRIELDGSGIGGTLDVRKLSRLEYLSCKGNYFTTLELPKSKNLTTLKLPATLTSLHIEDCPNLQNTSFDEDAAFSIEGAANLKSIIIKGSPYLNSYAIINAARNAELEEVVLYDINWEGVSSAVIEWLSEIPTCRLTGTITISNTVTFEQRRKMLSKWPNIGQSGEDGLTINYGIIPLSNGTVLTGDDYIWELGAHQYLIAPNPATANELTSISWGVAWVGSGAGEIDNYATIDQDGVLTVSKIGTDDTYKIRITCTIDSGLSTQRVITKNVGLYYREAEVGDFVFADGTWSDHNNPLKTVVGRCFYVNGTDRRMVALKPLSGMSTDGTVSSRNWGPANDSNGLPNYSFPYQDGVNNYSWYDTPALARSITNSYKLTEDSPQPHAITAPYPLTSSAEWILDIPLQTLVTRGRANTLHVINLRNRILNDTPLADVRASYGNTWPPADKEGSTEWQEVGLLINKLSTVGTNYHHLMFPAFSYVYAYEPNADGLVDKFKKHNWYLPSLDELECINYLTYIQSPSAFGTNAHLPRGAYFSYLSSDERAGYATKSCCWLIYDSKGNGFQAFAGAGYNQPFVVQEYCKASSMNVIAVCQF